MTTERSQNKPLPDLLREATAPLPLSDQKPPTPTGGTVSTPRRGGGDENKAAPESKPSGRVVRGG
jgi:hypothetical protein